MTQGELTPRHIEFRTVYSDFPWFRQTPGGDGIWKQLRIMQEPQPGEAEWLVVYEEAPDKLPTRIPIERRILFMIEPPLLKKYLASYLNQFGIIVSPLPPRTDFRGTWIRHQTALPWYYGVNMTQPDKRVGALDWEALRAPKENKTRELSVVVSQQNVTEEHRLRLAFVKELQAHFGEGIASFGRGSNPINDKAEALTSFRYHIALENNVIDHFWTEKLADPILADCYTFYFGCRNVSDYFDARGITPIDITRPAQAIAEIERVMASHAWEQNRDGIAANRRRLMDEHNLFEVIQRVVTAASPGTLNIPTLRQVQTIRAPHLSGWRNQLHWTAVRLRNRLLDTVKSGHRAR